MKKVKRSWDMLSKEKKRVCIDKVIGYFEVERGERIGVIAAEEVLDFVLQMVAGEIYNIGVGDSKKALKEKFEDLEVDLDILLSK
jgi:uncharacterized protein (DUF2164 family)